MNAGLTSTDYRLADHDVGGSDLAVVIPTRGRWATLQITLSALSAQTEQCFETVVVVDGEDQEVPELPGVRVLQQERAGPGVARNRGATATSCPLVLFLGDDMVPDEELIARHLAQHRRCPTSEVAVLGRVVWHPSVPRDRLHEWLDWSGALFDFPPGPTDDAGWSRCYSSNLSVKQALFAATGGFDADFVAADYEDLDLGWRLGQKGMRLVYEPRAVTRHLHPYDWDALVRRYQSRAGAERLMMEKHDWFEPWFYNQLTAAQHQRRVSRVWLAAVDRIPRGGGRVRRAIEKRADRYYCQQLAPAFLAAWEGATNRQVPRT